VYIKEVMNPKRLPSHTEIYEHIGKLEPLIMNAICDEMGWEPSVKTLFGLHTLSIRYDMRLEFRNWDIFVDIVKGTSFKMNKLIHKLNGINLGIEYKSSVGEWGKQIDAHIRQIKNRREKDLKNFLYVFPILLSFDESFEKYRDALELCDIKLVVIPYDFVLEYLNQD